MFKPKTLISERLDNSNKARILISPLNGDQGPLVYRTI